MKVYNSFDEIDYNSNTVLTLGTYDGVHIGHKSIIEKLHEVKSSLPGSREILITIHPHPQIVLTRQDRPKLQLLTSINERLQLLEESGLESVLILPFTSDFAQIGAEQFVSDYLVKKIGLKKFLIGYDHFFGRNREGSIELLLKLALDNNFEIETIHAKDINGIIVSSTKIRHTLSEGRLEDAETMLGYKYFLTGTVITGEGRGRTLGWPTANIQPYDENKLLPKIGVYFVKSEIHGKVIYGMANLGTRPTFNNSNHIGLEVFFFDFDEDIYDVNLSIIFEKYIREEIKFSTVDELKNQIRLDEKYCRSLIKEI